MIVWMSMTPQTYLVRPWTFARLSTVISLASNTSKQHHQQQQLQQVLQRLSWLKALLMGPCITSVPLPPYNSATPTIFSWVLPLSTDAPLFLFNRRQPRIFKSWHDDLQSLPSLPSSHWIHRLFTLRFDGGMRIYMSPPTRRVSTKQWMC